MFYKNLSIRSPVPSYSHIINPHREVITHEGTIYRVCFYLYILCIYLYFVCIYTYFVCFFLIVFNLYLSEGRKQYSLLNNWMDNLMEYTWTLLVNIDKRSECASLGCFRQKVVPIINGFFSSFLSLSPWFNFLTEGVVLGFSIRGKFHQIY